MLLADILVGLQELVNMITDIIEQHELELKIKKTKYMIISKSPDHQKML